MLYYLASLYSSGTKDQNVINQRYEEIFNVTVELIKRGYPVISPVAYTHNMSEAIGKTWNEWKDFDLRLLDACDALWVYTPNDDWKHSTGVQDEIAWAKLTGKPIFYFSNVDEV